MARTKQTARKSVGGKTPRGKGGKGLGKGSAGAPAAAVSFAKPQAVSNKRSRRYSAQAQLPVAGGEAEQQLEQVLVPAEITYTGTHDTAFYAHYFVTGEREKDQEVRCRYALAHTRDPLTQAEDCWVGVSYNSKYDGVGMKLNSEGRQSNRPALNLVVALDVSGSMCDTFRGDDDGDDDEDNDAVGGGQKKLQVAKDCLLALLGQLRDDDAFGLVIFNSAASVLQPLTKWSQTDKVTLEKAILKLRAGGGTQLTEGFKAATKMFANAEEGAHRSSRVFFLTDMEAGSEDERKFIATVKQNSEVSLWSTIIGIGMDLARDTVEETSKTPGCNYATVISNKDFKEMINNEFDYTVTPTGFNVSLSVDSDVWQLHSGYGSPEVSSLQPGGQAQHSTLFPSTQNDKGETRGGLFLFKLSQKQDQAGLDTPFTLISKWDNLLGIEQTDAKQVQFKEAHVDDMGIRKAALLVYYTDFIRPYLEVRNRALGLPSAASAVAAPMPTRYLSLITPENRFKLLNDFIAFYKKEMDEIQDASLNDELSFLETVHGVEEPFFVVDAKPSSSSSSAGDVEEKKRKRDDEGGAANDDEDDDEEEEDEEEAAKRRKMMEEADEQLARQLAAQEDEEQQGDGGVMTVEEVKDHGLDDEPNTSCVVCWSAKKSVLFLPCRHMCSCKACGDKTTECPLCRATIQQRTDVFV